MSTSLDLPEALSLQDVLLVPAPFSYIRSRKDVETDTIMCGKTYKLGLVSSNMTSVYSPQLAIELAKAGGVACVPRFYNSIEENVKQFKAGIYNDIKPWVSVGVGSNEFERAKALVEAGAEVVVIDVALGASIQVAEQFIRLKEGLPKGVALVVGNFADGEQIKAFLHRSKGYIPDLFKCFISSGAACVTARTTGVGSPTFSSLQSCVDTGYPILADGGVKEPGDFSKCLAIGAVGVMMGKNFAATEESGADTVLINKLTKKEEYLPLIIGDSIYEQFKLYSGSASNESYKQQGKVAQHRAPEGESYLVPISGTVSELVQNFEGGLRSSMSYLSASDLFEFKSNATFVKVTNNSYIEMNTPHGKQ